MPKIITKHRRGTTAEWEKSKIILEQGELVIEECEGEFAKLKIGDGKHTFAELPYVTKYIESAINEANSRIDQIISLNQDEVEPTDPEYEVIDIRVGHDGVKYPSAGSAVRSIGEDVSNLRKSLQQFIDADAVDGLFYENNMLYLTADGIIVSDPVEIKGGSGGGGTTSSVVIKLKSLNAYNTFSVTEGSKVKVEFEFTSTEDDIPTGDASCNIQVDGSSKKKQTIKQGYNELDITDYLQAGENNVRITCSDIYGNSRSLVYNITVIDLTVRSTFNQYITYDKDIDVRYSVSGAINKTVYFEIDGEVKEELTTHLTATSAGKESSQIIPISMLSHGVHKLVIYAVASLSEGEVNSNRVVYDVMVALPNETAPMIASVLSSTEIEEGQLLSIPYVVYDPNDALCDVTLQICYMEAGEEKIYTSSVVTVDKSLQYWNTRRYPAGEAVLFKIMYDNIVKVHQLKVTESNIDIEAEPNPILYLSSIGRDNTEAKPDVWESNGITTTFSGFNWTSNGWVKDSNGDTCLRLSGGATAEINYHPFNELDEKLTTAGRTFEFEFAIRDISNRDTTVISCYQDIETESGVKTIGLKATADKATLGTDKNTITCNYKDMEKLRISFTIDGNTEGSSKLLTCYMDGVLSGVFRYDDDKFSNTSTIKLGDTGCTLDLYSIRIYDKSLPARDILRNYIADTTDAVTKTEVYNDNSIYESWNSSRLSYEEVKKRIPTVTFTGQMPTFKGDKRVVKMDFHNPFDSSKNFSNVYGGPIDVLIDVQGTSSQYYVRKNWKIKLKDSKKGVDNKPYQHMDEELPATVFCLKVDYAEATGTHNTQNANFVETLYTEKVPAQYDDERIRTTITGFPIVIFEKQTEDSDPVFSSKGNFNFDKDAEDVFGFNENYDVECWEFCNNTSECCNFHGEIPRDWVDDFEPRYTPYGDDMDDIEDLQDLKDSATDKETGTIDRSIFTEEDEEKLLSLRDKVISAKFKRVHDWVVSTKDDLTKFKNEFEKYFDMHYSLIYYIYTFVALMVDQRAKNMFLTYWRSRVTKGSNGNWVIGGVDTGVYAANSGKPYVENDEWYIDGVSTGIEAGHWYPYFYDNDTSYGINNVGLLTFDYYHEDSDNINGDNVYNGQDSTLWVNFRKAFGPQIQEMYKTLRSDKLITYDKIINQLVTEGSDMYSASIYNEDAEYKYLSMARPGYSDKIDTTNLNKIRGDGEHHLKYFVQNRINYCDSKWHSGEFPDDMISFRINHPVVKADVSTEEEIRNNEVISASLQAVPFDSTIRVTPFSNMYCAVQYGAGAQVKSQRTNMNEESVFTHELPAGGDAETAIFGARNISDIGDLAPLYCSALDISRASKLSRLKVGSTNEGYRNAYLSSVTFSTSPLLKYIDLSNCVGITGSINLSGCENVEELYALGTKITGVNFSPAGYLKTIHLPETLETLSLKNQHNLHTSNISIGQVGDLQVRNLTGLTIVNCPNVNETAIFTACLTAENSRLSNVYITGVNWEVNDWKQLRKLYLPTQKQLDEGVYVVGENGNYFRTKIDADDIDTGIHSSAGTGYGLRGIDERNLSVDYVNIQGSCTVNANMLGNEMAELKKYLPYLKFSMGEGYKLSSTVYFMSDDGSQVIWEEKIETTETENVTCPDPVSQEHIQAPLRDSTISHSYVFAGWSRNSSNDRLYQPDALNNIAGDRVLYPAFSYTLNSYPVEFYHGADLLQRVENVTFYESAVYTGEEPVKYPDDLDLSELYPFAGWVPSPEVIESNLVDGVVKCYAQFKTIDEQWEVPYLKELSYTLNDAEKTIQITGRTTDWEDQPNVFVKFDPSFSIQDKGDYKLTSISGFDNFESLQLISIPDSVQKLVNTKVDDKGAPVGAFQNCSNLRNAIIPESCVDMGINCFADCTSLEEIDYRATNAADNTWSSIPFVRCESENGAKVIIRNNVKVIPVYTFCQQVDYKRAISEIIWEENSSCTEIRSNAFTRTNIKQFNKLPDSIKIIGQSAFQGNKDVTELILPNSEGLKVEREAFAKWTALTTLTIPEANITIEPCAFSGASSLETIISSNARYVVSNGCLIDTSNKSVLLGTNSGIIPDSSDVTKVEEGAFRGTKISEVNIPSHVTSIGDSAFYECPNISTVYIPDTVRYVGPQSFYRCQGLVNIRLPDNLDTISGNILSYTPNLESITIPEATTSIGQGAFMASGIQEIIFNNKLNSIGSACFAQCNKLQNVNIPNSVTEIGPRAFESCLLLSTVTLPDGLQKLNGAVFRQTALQEIVIPDSVTTITNLDAGYSDVTLAGSFNNCKNLRKVVFGKNTVDIAQVTFNGCDNIEFHTPNKREDLPEGWATGWGATNFTVIYESNGGL